MEKLHHQHADGSAHAHGAEAVPSLAATASAPVHTEACCRRRKKFSHKKQVSTNMHAHCNWLRVNYALSYACQGIIHYVEHCCAAQQQKNVAVFRDELRIAPCNHAEGTAYRGPKGGGGKKNDAHCPSCAAMLAHFRGLHRKPGHALNAHGGRTGYSCCRWGRADGGWDVARLFSRQPVPATTAADADASALLTIMFHYDAAFQMKAEQRLGTFLQQVLEVRNTLVGHLQRNELSDETSAHGVDVVLKFLTCLGKSRGRDFPAIAESASRINTMRTTGDSFFRRMPSVVDTGDVAGSDQAASPSSTVKSASSAMSAPPPSSSPAVRPSGDRQARGKRWAPRPPLRGFDTTGDGVIDAVDTSGDGAPDTKVMFAERSVALQSRFGLVVSPRPTFKKGRSNPRSDCTAKPRPFISLTRENPSSGDSSAVGRLAEQQRRKRKDDAKKAAARSNSLDERRRFLSLTRELPSQDNRSVASAVLRLQRKNDDAKAAAETKPPPMPPPPPVQQRPTLQQLPPAPPTLQPPPTQQAPADLDLAAAPSPPPSVRVGRSLVGRRVAILSGDSGGDDSAGGAEPAHWRRGVVCGHDAATGVHNVRYDDDGACRWEVLGDAMLKVLDAGRDEIAVWAREGAAASSAAATAAWRRPRMRHRRSSAGEFLRNASNWLFG